jgi:NAD(P)-dependent dehydrogenase (short-subunit alcohol dehydrogenase family)
MAAKPTALITGAAGGIGSALVDGFLAAGYDVVAVDRAKAEGVIPQDITDAAAVDALGAQLDGLNVLINAAGVLRRGEEYQPEVFASVLETNLTASMRLAVACKPALAKAGGAIINFASMYSFFGAAHAPAYAASKGGIVQLTKSLAVAWAKDNIRVNAIAPGWIVTPLTDAARTDEARNRGIVERTPMARWGTPQDLVGPALFLASDAARFVTGTVLPVDGGYAAM